MIEDTKCNILITDDKKKFDWFIGKKLEFNELKEIKQKNTNINK